MKTAIYFSSPLSIRSKRGGNQRTAKTICKKRGDWRRRGEISPLLALQFPSFPSSIPPAKRMRRSREKEEGKTQLRLLRGRGRKKISHFFSRRKKMLLADGGKSFKICVVEAATHTHQKHTQKTSCVNPNTRS